MIGGWLVLGAGGRQGRSIAIPNKFWDKNCVIDKGASENHKLLPLRRCAGTLVVITKISLLPVQASEADGVLPRGIGITRLDIEANASAGKAL
jgi:hypothetical protein